MVYKPAKDSASTDSDNPQLEKITAKESLYWLVMTGLGFVYATLFVLGYLTWNVILLDVGIQFNLGYWFFLLVALHIVGSFWGNDVQTDQHGVLYLFGLPIRWIKGAGLKFVPLWLITLDILPADMQEIHAPGKKNTIFWGDDEVPVPAGMVRAIRMTTKAPTDAETAPLDAQLTIGLGYFVLWTIKDPIQFSAHIRTIREAESQLLLISTRALSEIIATMTASTAIANQAIINSSLDDKIRIEVKSWGVEINNTGLTDINFSHTLATAMRDRAAAAFVAQTKVIAATATAKETELLGEAEGKAARARASGEILGRVDGMKAMMTELEVEGASVLSAEATRGVFKDADTVVVGAGDGLRDVLGAVMAGKSMLKDKEKKGTT